MQKLAEYPVVVKKAIHKWAKQYSGAYDSQVDSLVPQIRECGYQIEVRI